MAPKRTWFAALAWTGMILTACVPPPPDQDAARSFGPDSSMGQIQADGVIEIGVAADAPPFASGSPDEGFIVELGRMIAAELGVEARFVTADDPVLDLLDQGLADVAFPLIAMTEQEVRRHTFTDPYYVGHQRLLVRAGSGIAEPADLEGAEVCGPTDDPLVVAPVVLASTVLAVSVEPDACAARVADGDATAVTDLDHRLLLLLAEHRSLAIVGPQLSTYGLGAVVGRGDVAFANFIDSVFAEIKSDGRWQKAYEATIGALTREPTPASPDLTAEEAAALWPKDA